MTDNNNLNTDSISNETNVREIKPGKELIEINHDSLDNNRKDLNRNQEKSAGNENITIYKIAPGDSKFISETKTKNFSKRILGIYTKIVKEFKFVFNCIPKKSTIIYLCLYFIAFSYQNFLKYNTNSHNLFFLVIDAILNLSSNIGLYYVFINSLKNLNILTKQYLNIDMSQPKFNTNTKITLSLIIINSILSEFNWFYIYNCNYHSDNEITNLLVNNDVYLYLLAKISIFSNFCFTKLYIINWIFSFAWIFLYLKPLFDYYKNFRKLFPDKKLLSLFRIFILDIVFTDLAKGEIFP